MLSYFAPQRAYSPPGAIFRLHQKKHLNSVVHAQMYEIEGVFGGAHGQYHPGGLSALCDAKGGRMSLCASHFAMPWTISCGRDL